MIPLIDTHQHLWDLDRLKLNWVAGEPKLNRSFRTADYLAAVEGCGLEQSVYMEVDAAEESKDQEVADIRELCADPQVPTAGMVASANPAAAGFLDWLSVQQDNPHLKGVRQILHGATTEAGYCLQDAFVEGVRTLGEQGLLFDICIRPAELDDALKLALRCPETYLVLDHCGNAVPEIVAGVKQPSDFDSAWSYQHEAEQWKDQIAAIAECPNVYCKISGILARVPEDWDATLLAPTVNHCLDCFGPQRVLFAGDWPVCLLGGDLSSWVQAVRQLVAERSEKWQHGLLHRNARRLYRLSDLSTEPSA